MKYHFTPAFRAGFTHHEIEQSSVAMRFKLIAMLMVHELETMFGQGFSGAIEHGAGVAGGLLIEWPWMRDPCAAHRLEPEGFGFARDGLDVIAQAFVGKMSGDGFQPVRIELLLELGRCQVVGAGQFDVPESKVAHFLECADNVRRELIPQTVELQSR
jgi:hypothetical protein